MGVAVVVAVGVAMGVVASVVAVVVVGFAMVLEEASDCASAPCLDRDAANNKKR